MIELGAFLFTSGVENEAIKIFSEARDLQVPVTEKRLIRVWWKDATGKNMRFKGKVQSIHGGGAYVLAVPQNFQAFFGAIAPALWSYGKQLR